jgi:hypothetical protein
MKYFDYLETEWVISQKRLNVPPAEMTISNQARAGAVQAVIDVSRRLLRWGYMLYFVFRFLLIKSRIRKPPQYQSSIPAQPGPTLVKPEPPPSAA